MKDYYKIANELGLDAENTDFSSLIDTLVVDNEELKKKLKEIERKTRVGQNNWKTLCEKLKLRAAYVDPSDLLEELIEEKVKLTRENERLCQLIDNPR